ncbi:MAG TPA: hypothetical protein VEZ15_08615 [Acidimicrobiia bacterium]|nr:hypothetical protein [Acidimicrobiia bacterium]
MNAGNGESLPQSPGLVASGSVDRSRAGAPWWMYRRPGGSQQTDAPVAAGEGAPPTAEESRSVPAMPNATHATDGGSGIGAVIVAVVLLLFLLASAHWFAQPRLSRVLVPVIGLVATVGAGRLLVRRHPDEPWLPHLLVAGVIVKIIGCGLRYRTFGDSADASVYDRFGKQFAAFWLHKAGAAAPTLTDLRKSNFLRWFTGVVYYVFGTDMIAGYFVFGLLAFIGSYLWYRAAAEALPSLDRRLFLILVMFAPSIAFWPSSIGKEALMQFGIGSTALGTAHLLQNRVIRGLIVALPGAFLMAMVRPHLLGLVTLAAGAAYAAGRTRRRGAEDSASLFKPIGLVVVGFLVAFTVSQGAKSLGLPSLSLGSVQNELDKTTASTGQGNSKFNNGGNSLSPLHLPQGAVTVLLRPFPYEVNTGLQILASLEGVALAGFIIHRRSSVAMSLRKIRSSPFLFYCWTLTLLYAITFQAFANFGLLVRQRSLVLPALYVLLCLDPSRDRVSTEPAALSAPQDLGIAGRGS